MTRYEYDVVTLEDDTTKSFPNRARVAFEWITEQAHQADQKLDWPTLRLLGPRHIPDNATVYRVVVNTVEHAADGHELAG